MWNFPHFFFWRVPLLCSIESVHLPVARSPYLQSISWSRSLPRGVRCYNSGSWLRGGVIYADPVIIIHRLVINGIITMIKTWPASAHKLIQITHINTHHRGAERSTRGHAGCHLSLVITDYRLMPCYQHFEHSYGENMRYKKSFKTAMGKIKYLFNSLSLHKNT